MALDLARLDPLFPVWAIGAVGNDDGGRLLIAACAERGIDFNALRVFDSVASRADARTSFRKRWPLWRAHAAQPWFQCPWRSAQPH